VLEFADRNVPGFVALDRYITGAADYETTREELLKHGTKSPGPWQSRKRRIRGAPSPERTLAMAKAREALAKARAEQSKRRALARHQKGAEADTDDIHG